jgi:GAF domain-containing protein
MSDEASSRADRLVSQIQRLVQAIEASGGAVLPSSNLELLQSIVEAAARIFGARAASIALVLEGGREMEFKVAFNTGDQNVVGLRIPVNKGIAGYVTMTGQPLAVSDVQQDARFNRDFAESTGYIPQSILATPLISHGQVIGVMEVLDKLDAPSFGLQDMELLGIFANQAAVAIAQSQQIEHLGQALLEGLKKLAVADLSSPSAELLGALENQPPAGRDLLSLARLINDISSLGESERQACLNILQVFQEYSRTHHTQSFGELSVGLW